MQKKYPPECLGRPGIQLALATVLPFFLFSFFACSNESSKKQGEQKDFAVVAIAGDVDSFNPLFAEHVVAGEINDLFFPGLVGSRFDTSRGVLEYYPLLARSWDFRNKDRDIIFHLRTDARWSDGVPITSRDVRVTYELYSDPIVASVRQSSLEGLRKSKDGVLDIKRAIESPDDSTVIFHFERPYPGQLFDAGLPILPAHVFEGLPRKGLRENPVNQNSVVSGPFRLKSWKPMQEIILVQNPTSSLPGPAKLAQLIFRVIPDEYSRLGHLRTGEVDIVTNLRMEDATELRTSSPDVNVYALGERIYDAVNWNNIDSKEYARSAGKNLRAHPLFGNKKVRNALTLAINRQEIVQSYLGPYGRQAIGPVSPLFRWAYNDTLRPLPFEPEKAAAILAAEGWRDSDGDGVLDKNGRKLSFTMNITTGDKLRSNIAAIIQNQLRAIQIEMKIQQVERSVFWRDLMQKKYDAWIAGFSIPLQMQLDELWGSDLARSPFNLVSFQNRRVGEILRGAKTVAREADHAAAWKEFQVIFQEEQPCTFLYWKSELVAVNKRLRGTDIGVLGVLHRAWEWYFGDEVAIR